LKLSQSGDRCVKTVTPRQGLISCQAVLRRRVASLSRQTPFRSLPQQLRPVPLRLRQPLCEPKRWRLLYQPSYAQGAHDPRFSLRIETGDPNVPSCWHLNNYTRLALPGAAPQLSSSTHLTTAASHKTGSLTLWSLPCSSSCNDSGGVGASRLRAEVTRDEIIQRSFAGGNER
jgi:hypothetical protein